MPRPICSRDRLERSRQEFQWTEGAACLILPSLRHAFVVTVTKKLVWFGFRNTFAAIFTYRNKRNLSGSKRLYWIKNPVTWAPSFIIWAKPGALGTCSAMFIFWSRNEEMWTIRKFTHNARSITEVNQSACAKSMEFRKYFQDCHNKLGKCKRDVETDLRFFRK